MDLMRGSTLPTLPFLYIYIYNHWSFNMLILLNFLNFFFCLLIGLDLLGIGINLWLEKPRLRGI
jgi:hypothetical protein